MFPIESIIKIEAYKVDLFSYDSIAFDLTFKDRSTISFCEEDPEWPEIEMFVKSNPSVPSDWWSKVAFPPFAENRVVLFQRVNQSSGT